MALNSASPRPAHGAQRLPPSGVVGQQYADVVPDAERRGEMQRIKASQSGGIDRSSLVEHGVVEGQQRNALEECPGLGGPAAGGRERFCRSSLTPT